MLPPPPRASLTTTCFPLTSLCPPRHDRARARNAAVGRHRQRTRKPAIGLAPASGACGVAAAGLHARMDRLSGRFPGLRHDRGAAFPHRSEEHTSELPSLMRISYAGYRLKKKKTNKASILKRN